MTQTKAQQAKTEPPPEPEPLTTHHVFLDTQVYKSLGHNPESPLLREMSKKIKDGEIRLHITDITLWEIERQLAEMARSTFNVLKDARHQFRSWHLRLPKLLPVEHPEFDRKVVGAAAFEAFSEKVSTEWKATEHAASKQSGEQIFRGYFAGKPPFQARESKEFPDAFVIAKLEAWCVANNATMYVVGGDKAMGDAAEASPQLLRLRTLAELLQGASALENPDVTARAHEVLTDLFFMDDLEALLGKEIGDKLTPNYVGDLPEGEASTYKFIAIRDVVDHKVIAASESEISVVLDIQVLLLVRVDYERRDSAVFDREDGMWVGGYTVDRDIEADPVIRVFGRIETKSTLINLKEIEILTEEFDVHDDEDLY